VVAEVIQRAGALEETFADIEGDRWAVLGGESSFSASGAGRILARFLRSGADLHVVQGPLLTTQTADQVIEELRGADLDGILAVGGGLVIDTMKVVSLGIATESTSRDLLERAAEAPGEPLRTVAVPTTAGSGAERTPFAVLYVDGVKHSVDDPRLLPQTAIIDPLLMTSAPKPVAASAGLDALAHCVESTWACRSTPESQAMASETLRVVVENIEPAVSRGSTHAQESLAFASSTAGAAIAVTRTTAAHALSYYLTSIHGVPHGHAVALTLGALIEANGAVDNSTVNDPRGVAHVRKATDIVCQGLGIASSSEGHTFVSELLGRLGLARSVNEATGRTVDRKEWIESVNPERLANNPRLLDEPALLEIVDTA
jgi:alcohol dehydrogenase class IV